MSPSLERTTLKNYTSPRLNIKETRRWIPAIPSDGPGDGRKVSQEQKTRWKLRVRFVKSHSGLRGQSLSTAFSFSSPPHVAHPRRWSPLDMLELRREVCAETEVSLRAGSFDDQKLFSCFGTLTGWFWEMRSVAHSSSLCFFCTLSLRPSATDCAQLIFL